MRDDAHIYIEKTVRILRVTHNINKSLVREINRKSVVVFFLFSVSAFTASWLIFRHNKK